MNDKTSARKRKISVVSSSAVEKSDAPSPKRQKTPEIVNEFDKELPNKEREKSSKPELSISGVILGGSLYSRSFCEKSYES